MGAYDACGYAVPVIMTGFGGQLDFLGPQHPLLVKYKLVPVNDRDGWPSYDSYQNWAEVDLVSASAKMRYVFENYESVRFYALELREDILHKFDETLVISNIVDTLEQMVLGRNQVTSRAPLGGSFG